MSVKICFILLFSQGINDKLLLNPAGRYLQKYFSNIKGQVTLLPQITILIGEGLLARNKSEEYSL